VSEISTNGGLKSVGGTVARTGGWAVYLAMSWTWCIGMFLPVLLMRELGLTGVIFFAVPNIVGAAAMGWIIRGADESRRMIEENRASFVWFSLITIAYHAFFAAWMIRRLIGPSAGPAMAAVFFCFWMILQWKKGGNFLAPMMALLISIAVIGWGVWRKDLPYLAHPVGGMRLDPIDNFWLAPVWVFGFLCCPFLDMTFHAARQALSRAEARAAFAIGFGILFAFMLAITVGYSGWFIAFDPARNPQVAMILAVHLMVQSCLTVALHVRQISPENRRPSFGHFLVFGVVLLIAVGLGVWEPDQFSYNGIGMGELIYRVFLGFYGLVFPAIVWLRIVPPRRSMLRVVMAIVVAAPLYWLGFADEKMVFMVPGVLIVVLSKFLPDTRGMQRNRPVAA
jgi:hypothetical protein